MLSNQLSILSNLLIPKKILTNVSFSFEFEKTDTRYSELSEVNVRKVDLLMF